MGAGTDKVGLAQLQKSRMASKLARQMAYKKRLEEEYREFQERCKVRQNILIIIILIFIIIIYN